MLDWLRFTAHRAYGSSPVTKFLLSPTLFAVNYLLIPNSDDMIRGINRVTIVPLPNRQARQPDNSLANVYVLRLAQGAEESFDAFWCPYVPNSIRSVVIDSAADYMFTEVMDGCSLGVGSRTPQGGHLVSHSNQSNVDVPNNVAQAQIAATQRGLQRAAQEQAIIRRHRQPLQTIRVIAPEEYRTDPTTQVWGLLSTTFGVRDSATDRWKFHCLRYAKTYNVPVYFQMCDLLQVHET